VRLLKFSVVIVLALIAVAAASLLAPKPAEAAITYHKWLNTTYEGYDPFYQANVVAYKTSTTAELVARVDNNAGSEISIDFGRLELSWTTTLVEATERPSTIAAGKYGLFRWQFTMPDTTTASNLLMHSYKVTVQYDVAGGVSDQQWTRTGTNLVVYTEDQAICRDLVNQWNINLTYPIWGYECQRAMTEASYYYNKADDEYSSGNFDAAKEDYETAVEKQVEAIKKDAGAALTPESAQTLEGTGGTRGVGFLLGGIGILVVGLGFVVWALRREQII